MDTVYVLIDNTEHEPNVVGVYLSRQGAENAWQLFCEEQGWLAYDFDHDDDDRSLQYGIHLAPMPSK